MDHFPDVTPLWDLNTSHHLAMQDQDFLELLSKQFPSAGASTLSLNNLAAGANPSSSSSSRPGASSIDTSFGTANLLDMGDHHHLFGLSPPSASGDSSPSPPGGSGGGSADTPGADEGNSPSEAKKSTDGGLKRKATDDDDEHGRSKTANRSSASASGATSGGRRKSTGSTKDEGRLMKRKEQNRAAQRAFRERKEKHVKDLEDKVADLEAQNEQALQDNENLRDMVKRLQTENVALKQSAFSFSVPRGSSGSIPIHHFPSVSATPIGSNSKDPTSPGATTSPTSAALSTNPTATTTNSTGSFDWNALTTFDPSMLNLLDNESIQPTATTGAMNLDFGFGDVDMGLAANSPYTPLASNPLLMSLAASFDGSGASTAGSMPGMFSFDMGWDVPAAPVSQGLSSPSSISMRDGTTPGGGFDDIFGAYMYAPSPSTSIGTSGVGNGGSVGAGAATSPTSRHLSPSSISSPSVSTPSTSSIDAAVAGMNCGGGEGCPKTRDQLQGCIEVEGESAFVSSDSPFVTSSGTTTPGGGVVKKDNVLGSMISCAGKSGFPKVGKDDRNIEVLTAWRSITSDPKYKDVDINDLCSEFSAKAKCDGTKVVIEPSEVHSIMESITRKR